MTLSHRQPIAEERSRRAAYCEWRVPAVLAPGKSSPPSARPATRPPPPSAAARLAMRGSRRLPAHRDARRV
ncbi:hypothetical protein EVAR_29809_1 [Eumeta japonica]|uniref:Uncharacterized protein n=1 Tax=Eumeta variegata TaxID=151549 RepID=A0A4C1XSF1_EUMVA|nr:hypothetical protein EVAR_29809_1 [Eumeta japonica]